MSKSVYPDNNERYKEKSYWDERYLNEKSYEWCKSYVHFRHLITAYVEKGSRILILGCGNSKLSEDLYEDGYENITNIDFSSIVLHNVKSDSKTPRMEWLTMDIKRLFFRPASFDLILEKATLDSLLVSEKDPWKISAEAQETFISILMQVSDLLVNGGKFLSLTFAQPHFRKKLLCRPQFKWSVKHETYGVGLYFFFYVMVKGEPLIQENCEQSRKYEPEQDVVVGDLSDDDDEENFINSLLSFLV